MRFPRNSVQQLQPCKIVNEFLKVNLHRQDNRCDVSSRLQNFLHHQDDLAV